MSRTTTGRTDAPTMPPIMAMSRSLSDEDVFDASGVVVFKSPGLFGCGVSLAAVAGAEEWTSSVVGNFVPADEDVEGRTSSVLEKCFET